MGSAYPATPAEILLVEDDEDLAFFTRRAFEKAQTRTNVHHVNNGKKCLEFLRREPPYSAAPVPDIVLLDIEMPVMDGREVLAEIVKDDALKHLAVIVLTTRDEHEEILRMYQMRCSSYICKPVEFDKYVDMIGNLTNYWLSVVMLPRRDRPPAS